MKFKSTHPSTSINATNTPSSTINHFHSNFTNHHFSLTNPSSFYPSNKPPFSFRANSFGYNLNFFDISKAHKYFKYNSKTHRFHFTSKNPFSTISPKTPMTKPNLTTRNFSFSNKQTITKPSYIKIFNKNHPFTPKHSTKTNPNKTNSLKSKRVYTPVYNKINNQRYSENKAKGKKLTSLSDNNINGNGNRINSIRVYKTIAYKEKVKKKGEAKDDIISADLISAQERRKVILFGGNVKNENEEEKKEFDKKEEIGGNEEKKQRIVKIQTKRLNNKKYLSINTNYNTNENSKRIVLNKDTDNITNSNNKQISKTPKTKTFPTNINIINTNPKEIILNTNNKHSSPKQNITTNNEHNITEGLRSFNSLSNYGNTTQSHFKNKYRNLFENYFSSNDDNINCITTSYI